MPVNRRIYYGLLSLTSIILILLPGICRATATNDHHQAEIPSLYYIHWGLLGISFLIVSIITIRAYKSKSQHNNSILTGLFILVAVSLYSLDQLPALHGYFDATTHKFISGYHESSPIGFIKFIYKVALGIFMTVYAFLGMHKHHE